MVQLKVLFQVLLWVIKSLSYSYSF